MKQLLLSALIGASFVAVGCGGNQNVNSTANNSSTAANTNAAARPNNNAESTPAPSTNSTDLSLATPTDAYKAAYEYRKTKNIEGLKKVMSKDVLDFLTEIGEVEKKTLDDMLRELCEKPQAPTNETRNLKIKGDTATLQYPAEGAKNWTTVDFVKVGNEWKMTIPKDPQDVEIETKKPERN